MLSVPQEKLDELLELSASEDVEATVIGTFGTPRRGAGPQLPRHGSRPDVDGLPAPRHPDADAEGGGRARPWHGRLSPCLRTERARARRPCHGKIKTGCSKLLAHPNIASKHWIIRQYDHEVQGGSVIKPLIGPLQIGPSDAAVIRPKLDSYRGVALGVRPGAARRRPVRHGDRRDRRGDPQRRRRRRRPVDRSRSSTTSAGRASTTSSRWATLVRTCEACRDAALAYGIPFISGKDSLHNQFTNSETGEVIRIPNTLLISAIGVIDDVRKCVTMDLKDPREGIARACSSPPTDSLASLAATHRAVAQRDPRGARRRCHDVSDGGVARRGGGDVHRVGPWCGTGPPMRDADAYFAEGNGAVLVDSNA